MKTAIVHDWLLNSGGAEKVLKAIYSLYPSPIYTLVCKDFSMFSKVQTSFVQKLPFARKWHWLYLSLFPMAIEQFDLSDYDLILSSSHSVAKGVLTRHQQIHVCYCHTPMRYAWDLYFTYLNQLKGVQKTYAKHVFHQLRKWDVASSMRVNYFIANSNYVAARIRHVYKRKATVIYPPVETTRFRLREKEDFYLCVARLVSYKKVDLIIDAFQFFPKRRLIVIGDGPKFNQWKKKAGKNVKLLGYQNEDVVTSYFERAKAFIYAAEEDFGIALVEAQAAGTPVIAFNKGGASETVLPNKTGILFEKQTIQDIVKAISLFEKLEFDSQLIKRHAEDFASDKFKKEFSNFVSRIKK